jgi:L-lactate dehydrogenase complex protein LldE
MFNNGLHQEAAELARRMIACFEPFSAVVTPSGSCASMIRERYPALLARDDAWSERARNLAGKTCEFVDFLRNRLGVDLAAIGARRDGTVGCHEACHMRGLGLFGQTERELAKVPGLTIAPMAHAEQCCGFGGTFATNYPDVSEQMVKDKVEAVRGAGVRTLVCGDAGCAMNIAGACRRSGVDVRLLSPAEIIAESLGLLPRGDA